MNIVIAGDGEVGYHLAKLLADENHNITIIDPHQELLKMIEAHTDLLAITGDSTFISVLEEANISKTDLLISVLHDEKTNIITSILAKKLGAKKCIARINNPEYLSVENQKLFSSLGIDHIICPERIASKEIVRLLKQSAAIDVVDFSDNKLSLFLLKLDDKAPVIGKSLTQIAREFPNLMFRAIAIHRNDETIIPKGVDRFLVGDMAYVICQQEGVADLMELGGKINVGIRNVMIVGGGRVGRKTALRLEKEYHIKLIEKNKDKCIYLTNFLDHTLIINGDARDIELLQDEGLNKVDAFIAVTDNSETNILTCLHAKKYGAKKTIALVENIDYIDISQHIGIDTIINKKLITASYMVRFTLNPAVTSLKYLSSIDGEVMELVAQKNSQITKAKIKDIKLPDGAVIGGVIRGIKSYIATGDFQILPMDKVVVFSNLKDMHKVEDLFK